MPLRWDQVAEVDAADYTLATVPAIYARDGDAHAGIDDAVGSLDALLGAIRASTSGRAGRRRAVAAELPQAGVGAAPRPALAATPRECGLQHAGGGGRAREVARRDGAALHAPGRGARGRAGGRLRPRAVTDRPARLDQALVEIARAAKKDEAVAGLERWKVVTPTSSRTCSRPIS